MAQVKKGSDKPHKISSSTIDGIQFTVNMFAAAVNTPIGQADFVPEKVSAKAVLSRPGKADIVLFNTNLSILAQYSTIQRNRNKWLYGFDLLSPTTSQKASKMRAFKYSFDTCIRLSGEDQIIVTVSIPDTGAWTSTIDELTSYIEFKEVPAIGYEIGIPTLETQVMEAASTGDTVSLGEDVMDVVFLNLDKNDLEQPVLNSVNISSSYFNRSMNYRDLITNHYNLLPFNNDERIGSTIPMAAGSSSGRVFEWLSPYPQSFYIHKGRKHDKLLHAKLELSMNAEYVFASKNYIVFKKLITDGETIRNAHERAAKHDMEDLSRLDKKNAK